MFAALFTGFTGIITFALLAATALTVVLGLVLKGDAKAKIRSITPYFIGGLIGWVVVTIVLYFIW